MEKKYFIPALIILILALSLFIKFIFMFNISLNESSINKTTENNTFFSNDDCHINEDCQLGFHCNNNKCLNNKLIEEKQNCSEIIDMIEYQTHCVQNCVNCISGKYSCWSGAFLNSTTIYKCLECNIDEDCKTGFQCENYSCISLEKSCVELGGNICNYDEYGQIYCKKGDLFRTNDSDNCCLGECN